MKNWTFSLPLIGFWMIGLCVANPLHSAAGEIGLLGGLNYWKPSANASFTPAVTTHPGYTAGFYYEYGSGSILGIETGAMYTYSKADYQIGAQNFAYKLYQITVPLIFRIHTSSRFAFGLGGYLTVGNGPVNENGTDKTYGDMNWSAQDWGFLYSFSVRFPLSEKLRLVIDGRYLLGLHERILDESANQSQKERAFQILAGVGYAI